MLILCYHKIDCVQQDWTGIVTSPDTFRQQLTYLKDHYHICDVRDFPRQPQEKDVLITFDDGYADNYTTALPILEELQIPATFFISTGHLDTDTEDWCNELAWLILEGDAYPPAFSFGNLHFKTESFQRRLSMHRSIEKALNQAPNIQRNAVMDAVRQWAGADQRTKRTSHHMLSADQLRALAASSYASIGAHTVNHPSLGGLSAEEQRYEILEAKHAVEEITGKDVVLFAYPFGGIIDYSLETIDILKNAGFLKAFSTTYKRKTKEPSFYEIPRVCISECTFQDFIDKLSFYRIKDSYWWDR